MIRTVSHTIAKASCSVDVLRRLHARFRHYGFGPQLEIAANELERTREAFANLQHAIEAEGYYVLASINTPTKFTLEKKQAE